MTEKLGRFGHHPNPVDDFCVEVDRLEGLAYDVSVGVADRDAVADQIARAMDFQVGAVEMAVSAKHRLRAISL